MMQQQLKFTREYYAVRLSNKHYKVHLELYENG